MSKKAFWQYALVGLAVLAFASWFVDGREDKALATAVMILAFYVYVQEQRVNRQAEYINATRAEIFGHFDRIERRLKHLENEASEPARTAKYKQVLANLTDRSASSNL